jgi:hypothetical protein
MTNLQRHDDSSRYRHGAWPTIRGQKIAQARELTVALLRARASRAAAAAEDEEALARPLAREEEEGGVGVDA